MSTPENSRSKPAGRSLTAAALRRRPSGDRARPTPLAALLLLAGGVVLAQCTPNVDEAMTTMSVGPTTTSVGPATATRPILAGHPPEPLATAGFADPEDFVPDVASPTTAVGASRSVEALRAAADLEAQGREAAAALAYVEMAGDAEHAPAERALAAQSAARLALAVEDFSGTLAALDLAPPDLFRAPEAEYLRGEALSALGRPDEAVLAFEAYALARPAMADEAALAIGDVLAGDGRPELAAREYERALGLAYSQDVSVRAALSAGDALLEAGDPEAARAVFEQAERISSPFEDRAAAIVGRVRAASALGLETEATEQRLRLVNDAPGSDSARVALAHLLEAGEAVPDFLVAYIFERHGEPAEALARYKKMLAAGPRAAEETFPARESLYSRVLEVELEMGRPEEALAMGDALLADMALEPLESSNHTAASVAFGRALALRALDRRDAEIDALTYVSRHFADAGGYVVAQSLIRRAQLIEARDGNRAGMEAWDRVSEHQRWTYGQPGFRSGWLAYLEGLRRDAGLRWQHVTQSSSDDVQRARAHFWLGHLGAENDDMVTARAQWRSTVDVAPDSWYALRAAARLDVVSLAVPDGAALGRESDPALAIEAWVDSWHATFDPVQAAAIAARSQVAIQRARALLALGRRQRARHVLLSPPKDLADDYDTRSAFALEARAMGFHDVALEHSMELQSSWLTVFSDSLPPISLWRLGYPDPWPAESRAAAAAEDVPLALLLALVREASRFESDALSRDGARGLTQLAPATADDIAARLGESGFTHDDLDQPARSLRFGAAHLGPQLEHFDGRPGPAIAAYRAGPAEAERWWSAARGDTERLVETIEDDGLRTFVRRVLFSQAVYERILAQE